MSARTTAMLLCAALALPLAAPVQAQSGGSTAWNFRVYLDDKPIGYHRFTLNRQGDDSELKSEARFDVKVLFINAYRYVHDATERWSGRCLKAMTARTDDDGERFSVNAATDGASLNVSVARGAAQGAAPVVRKIDGCAMSFAYWDTEILRQSRLLNAQTGEYESVTVSAAGEERITVRGKPVDAKRFRITGPKNPIDLWYSAAGDWLALESAVGGGRRLIYRIE